MSENSDAPEPRPPRIEIRHDDNFKALVKARSGVTQARMLGDAIRLETEAIAATGKWIQSSLEYVDSDGAPISKVYMLHRIVANSEPLVDRLLTDLRHTFHGDLGDEESWGKLEKAFSYALREMTPKLDAWHSTTILGIDRVPQLFAEFVEMRMAIRIVLRRLALVKELSEEYNKLLDELIHTPRVSGLEYADPFAPMYEAIHHMCRMNSDLIDIERAFQEADKNVKLAGSMVDKNLALNEERYKRN
jgi:hypothetical protein